MEHGIYARRYLISAGDEKAVHVWDLKENDAVRTMRRQSGPGDEGKIDHSPTGTGWSARMAVLGARGQMAEGDVYRAGSVIGSDSCSQIARQAGIGGRKGIVPINSTSGLDYRRQPVYARPVNPWPSGYWLSDLWPRVREAI